MRPLSLLLLGWTATALGHGGGLDGHGCHHDRKHGGYHCHRGAHAGEAFASQAEMLNAGAVSANLGGTASGRFGPCGSKTVCSQMESCEEARFFLNTCDLGRLDGDGDGVPCESVCR